LNVPGLWQLRAPEPSTINETTAADFTRVVEQAGILERATQALPRLVRMHPLVRRDLA
jgi:hypothetical protein